jgi:hypothetical protein
MISLDPRIVALKPWLFLSAFVLPRMKTALVVNELVGDVTWRAGEGN